MTVLPVPSSPASVRRRRGPLVLLAVLGVVLIAAGLAWTAFPVAGPAPGVIGPIPIAAGPPGAEDGVLEVPVSVLDGGSPAVDGLDDALRDALGQAAAAAAAEGIEMEVTSGWRSRRYQQQLQEDAVAVYGSREEASRWVASPETSAHVTGRAVDIGPIDAQFWMMQHGARWGLCQTFANERWHYELSTSPGGACPAQRMDAAG